MNIIYENKDIAVCEKEIGMSSQHTPSGDGLTDILADKYGYAAVINRLDTPVGGACLVAKNAKAASFLSKLVSENGISKTYLAVVEGCPQSEEGIYKDLLFKDSSKNKSFVVKRERRGVKKASLEYRIIKSIKTKERVLSLVEIKLHTGRTHQIRVQFSSRKMPLCGDGKYGSKDNQCSVSLWSHKLSFKNLESMEFEFVSNPPFDRYPWNLFNKTDE